jgi:uncharacterized membrane-anchored protein YitT (DUF2179 family)
MSVLLFYYSDILTPGIWYMIINIPVFFIGWKFISKRFLYYSLFGAILLTVFIDMVQFEISIKDHWLAVLAGGSMIGAGAGIVFSMDPDAFLITENTFNVLGKGFSQRKVY